MTLEQPIVRITYSYITCSDYVRRRIVYIEISKASGYTNGSITGTINVYGTRSDTTTTNPLKTIAVSIASSILSRTYQFEEIELYDSFRVDVTGITHTADIAIINPSLYATHTVSELTESAKQSVRFDYTQTIKADDCTFAILKAFVRLAYNAEQNVYCRWDRTYDGVTYYDCTGFGTGATLVYVTSVETTTNESNEEVKNITYAQKGFEFFQPAENASPFSPADTISSRHDCLKIPDGSDKVDSATYRFTICTVKSVPETVVNPESAAVGTTVLMQDQVLAQREFRPSLGDTYEFSYNPLGNAVAGQKFYYKNAVYTFGTDTLKNNILVSDTGSATTPITNTLDLNASSDTNVTALVAWRDYLIAMTEQAVYLCQKTTDGFYSKVVNTFVGVPKSDGKTCKTILNGILFKSGKKVYTLQPNLYATDDTILNIAELSKPIEHVLDNIVEDTSHPPFAFSTDAAYYLFIPNLNETTTCLKYTYTFKTWVVYSYPCIITDYEILDVNDIRLFGIVDSSIYTEFYFEKDINEAYTEGEFLSDSADTSIHGDVLRITTETDVTEAATLGTDTPTRIHLDVDEYADIEPISFSVDTGQKTDNIVMTKNFVETKCILATKHPKDTFPINVQIAVDGESRVLTRDINTDAPFWRQSSGDILTLNSAFNTVSADTYCTLRQLFLRYSGKGKTIRHVLSGNSVYDFKLYEILYRFSTLNVKQ